MAQRKRPDSAPASRPQPGASGSTPTVATVQAEPPRKRARALPGTEKVTEKTLNAWFTRTFTRWKPVRDKDEALRQKISRRDTPTHIGAQGEGNELASVVVRSGSLKTLEREFVGITSSVPPRIEALSKGIGPLFQRRADAVEEWARAWLHAVRGEEVISLVDTNQIRYGRGVYFVTWASQYWSDLPTQDSGEPDKAYNRRVEQFKREAPPAVVLLDRPAPQCMWDEDDLTPFVGPARGCYWEIRSTSDLAARYPDSTLARQYTLHQNAPDFIDQPKLHVCFANRRYQVYATAGGVLTDPLKGEQVPASLTHTTLFDWELVDEFDHGLNKCPLVVQVASSSDDPELVNRYEGLFDNALDLIDKLDDLLTQTATLARRYARAVPTVEWQLGPDGKLPAGIDMAKVMAQPIEWTPDRVQQFWPGQNPGWWQPDLAGLKELGEILGIFERYIQRDTLAPSSYGRGVNTESGFQLVTLIEAGERKLAALMGHKKRALESVLDLVFRWVTRIASEGHSTGVIVRAAVTEEGSGGPLAKEITKEDFLTLTADQAAAASVAVHVEARLDAADAAAAQIGLQISQVMAQNGIDVDPAWILSRWFHLENPERHQKAADLWRFLKRPDLQNWVARLALESAEMLVDKSQSEFVQQLALLTPAELLLVPAALQQVLAQRGLLPGPAGVAPGAAPPGAEGALGVPPGLAPPGAPPGTPQLGATLSGAAPPGPPEPMGATTTPGSPRMPGLGMPAAGPDIHGLGLGGISRAGQPSGPARAGTI